MTEPVSTATQIAEARTLRRTDPERDLALGRDLYSAALGGGDRRGAADAFLTLALCHLDAADYNAAAEHLGEAQALFAALENGAGEAEVAVLQGVVLCRRGNYDGAQQLSAAGVEAQALGDAFEVSETLLYLSRTYRFLGAYEQVLRRGLEALALKRSAGDTLGEAYALNNLGLICHDPYDSEQALSYYLQGLALSEKPGNRRSKLVLLGNLAELSDDMGDLDRSLDYTRQSLALSEEIRSAVGTLREFPLEVWALYTLAGATMTTPWPFTVAPSSCNATSVTSRDKPRPCVTSRSCTEPLKNHARWGATIRAWRWHGRSDTRTRKRRC